MPDNKREFITKRNNGLTDESLSKPEQWLLYTANFNFIIKRPRIERLESLNELDGKHQR